MSPAGAPARPGGSPRLHVGVNLLWLEHGVVGGSETYSASLLGAVAAHRPPDLDVTLFCSPSFAAAHPRLAAAFRCVVSPLPARPRPVRVAAEATWLARAARRAGVDLVHHFGGQVPVRHPQPAVVTIHDTQPLEHPERFGRAKGVFLRAMLPAAVRWARLVQTPSAWVASRVHDLLGADAARLQVAYPCVEGADLPAAGERPTPTPGARGLRAPGPTDVRRRLGLATPYFLYPSIVYAHKNHEVLLGAVAELAARDRPGAVVVTGGPASDPALVARLDARAAELGVADRWRQLGRVDERWLDALYRHAAGVVFPSTYEGFGLPVAEAMARDCPVVAARAAALPEIVGDAGLLVDPADAAGWADAMTLLVADPAERLRRVAAGRAEVRRFASGPTAAALVAGWRRVATPTLWTKEAARR